MTVRTGLVGVGGIAAAHFPAFRRYNELDVGGVCDIDESAAQPIAEEFDVDHWTDYERFVEEAPLDAIDIVLPHHLHYPVAKAALEADLHVHVEKRRWRRLRTDRPGRGP